MNAAQSNTDEQWKPLPKDAPIRERVRMARIEAENGQYGDEKPWTWEFYAALLRDVEAELERLRKEVARLDAWISEEPTPVSADNPVDRTPQDIVTDQDEEAVGQLQDEIERLRGIIRTQADDLEAVRLENISLKGELDERPR